MGDPSLQCPTVSSHEHVLRNRVAWDKAAAEYEEPGRRNWSEDPSWGIWGIPEASVHILPSVDGLETVELGCGTAYVSAWLARHGARPVGLDNSPVQLRNARTFQDEFELRFPLIHADAEKPPFKNETFDLAISEYGASLWCDPYRWIPEAARILRPGGELIFLTNGALLMLCAPESEEEPAGETLLRPYFGMHRFEWPGDDAVEFHLGHGDLLRLLRRSGFEVEELIELQPPESATTRYPFVTLEWARRWPSEEVWKARKR